MDSPASTSSMSRQSRALSAAIGRVLMVVAAAFFIFTQVMTIYKLTQPFHQRDWFIEAKTHHVIDFFQFYQVSDLAKSSLSHRVYEIDVQKKWHDDVIKPYTTDKVFYNQQPPFSYVLLLPLSLLPPKYAYPLWCVLQTIFGLTGLFILTRSAPTPFVLSRSSPPLTGKGLLIEPEAETSENSKPRFFNDRLLFLLGVLSSFPTFMCLWHGNTTFWLIGFLSIYIYGMYSRKDILAGVTLALSTFKPQYFFTMALPVLAMKRWKVALAAVVSEVVLTAAAIPIIGLENTIFYPSIVAHAESSPNLFGVNDQWMVSIRGLFAQFLTSKQSLLASAAVMFFGLIPLFLIWRWAIKSKSDESICWAWAVTIVFSLFASPHAHVFDWMIISMAAALTLRTLSLQKLFALPIKERLWCGFLILFPFLSWMANYILTWKKSPTFFLFPSATFLLVLSAMIVLEKIKSAAQADG